MLCNNTACTVILLFIASFLSEYLLLGKIRYKYHVINLMGYIAGFTENIAYMLSDGIIGGVVFSAATIFIISGISIFLAVITAKISLLLFYVFFIYIVSSFLSTGGLEHAGLKVYGDLKGDDIIRARADIMSLAGRDSSELDESEISRAAIESIAENTGDGIGSLFFYIFAGLLTLHILNRFDITCNFSFPLANNTGFSDILFISSVPHMPSALLFGLLGGVIYKTANLMDSLVGYKNDKYLRFGKFSARLDDILNYIPFRITAFFMLLSVIILRVFSGSYSIKNALKSWLNFRKMHPSPNAGQLESVMAGALKIRLGGTNYYEGVRSERAAIGFEYYGRAKKIDILKAVRVMRLTSFTLIAFYALLSAFLI